MEVAGPPKRLMDTSNEVYPVYKWNVCLGRLANLATQKKDEAKRKMTEVVLSGIGERIVILKARRDFVPFEQQRFDNGY